MATQATQQVAIIGAIALSTDFFVRVAVVLHLAAHLEPKCHPSLGLERAVIPQMEKFISFRITIVVVKRAVAGVYVIVMKTISRFIDRKLTMISIGAWEPLVMCIRVRLVLC